MTVVQVPFCFYPDPVGGTEVYVEVLARCLKDQGEQVVVAAPGKEEASYRHEGLPVRRFPAGPISDLKELYGEGNPVAAQAFARLLEEERPDLVHLHAFTRGVSLRFVREAKRRNIPVVFTYHTPTVSCQRGTLLRWGKEICDGMLRPRLCTECTLSGLGMGRLVSPVLSCLPLRVGRAVASARLSGGIWTALRMRGLIELRQATCHALVSEVDQVIALCQWTRELLLRNGVPEEKITLVRHGLAQSEENKEQRHNAPCAPPAAPHPRLRIVALGRMDPTKGFDILIRAVRRLPRLGLQLDIYGVAQDKPGERYARHLKKLAGKDPRIRFPASLREEEKVSRLRRYDLVAVPSQWLETGPLVVLEAFAAGVPVVGSNLGGIAELVQDGLDGLLVEHFSSPAAWADQLRRLSEDREFPEGLRRGIRPPRTMEAVAEEMMELYLKLAGKRSMAGRG